VIECLCPNNHKIRCPDELAGRAAKCPKCGLKFPIPTNGSGDKPPADREGNGGLLGNMSDSHISLDAWEKPQGESSAAVLGGGKSTSSIKTSASTTARLQAGSTANAPSMAKLFAQLWAEKPKDAIMELVLRSGEIYKPDMYSKKLSLQHQGVFAAKEMDGTYTIFVVSWEALSHMQIRKMRDLPSDFE
jgi:hypothetical protein